MPQFNCYHCNAHHKGNGSCQAQHGQVQSKRDPTQTNDVALVTVPQGEILIHSLLRGRLQLLALCPCCKHYVCGFLKKEVWADASQAGQYSNYERAASTLAHFSTLDDAGKAALIKQLDDEYEARVKSREPAAVVEPSAASAADGRAAN